MKKSVLIVVLFFLQWLMVACTPNTIRSGDDEGRISQDQRGPSRADVYVKLAVAYMQQGQVSVALDKAKQGLEVDPDSPDAHNIIALIYERLAETELAEQHYGKALALNSSDPYIRNAYGSFLCSQGRYEEARRHYKAALNNALYQTPEVALTNAGICAVRAGEEALAEKHFRDALRSNPKFPLALYQMIRVSFKKAHYLSARGYLQRYLEVGRHTAETLWLGIRIEQILGDLDALASYELLLRAKFPDSKEMQAFEESKKR